MKKLIYLGFILSLLANSCSFGDDSTDKGDSNSINGSTSRFVTHNKFMYSLDHNKIKIFDISNPADPQLKNEVHINDILETVTVYKDNLFIGAQRGVYAIDISNPLHAKVRASVEHWVARDPVALDGIYLYSTTRQNFSGRLTVYKDIGNEFISLKSIFLEQPYGLGINGDYLYVCDDKDGILIYNISNREDPIKAGQYNSISSPRDVIIIDSIMICSAKNEFHILDITEGNNPRLVSIIR